MIRRIGVSEKSGIRQIRVMRKIRVTRIIRMPNPNDRSSDRVVDHLLTAWRTNARVTSFLVERLPAPLWAAPVPNIPRRTFRGIAAHLHNSRVTWTRTLGEEHGIAAPALVSPHRVSKRELLAALRRSADGIAGLVALAIEAGGTLPPSRRYVWRNLPLDVGHVLTYFVAHEAHHRGQLVMAARQLGQRLPREIVDGLWQWTTRSRE